MAVEQIGAEFGSKSSTESLEDSMAAFNQAHRDNTDAILNIHEGRKKNAARVYVHQPFPKHVYHPDGRDKMVGSMDHPAAAGAKTPEEARRRSIEASQDELDAAIEQGFRTEPYIKPRVAVLSPAEEKASADKRFSELAEQNRQMADLIARMQVQLEAKPTQRAKSAGKSKDQPEE